MTEHQTAQERIEELKRQLDSARTWAVELEGRLARVAEALDPGELECGRLGLSCRSVHGRERWCRACRLSGALEGTP